MTMQTLTGWQPVPIPPRAPLMGQYVDLEPLSLSQHGDDLWDALQGAGDPVLWDYLPYGPFLERAAFDRWLGDCATSADPMFFTVIDRRRRQAVGLLSFMRITPAHGCIEIGHVVFGPAMQRSPASTEAIYLLARLALVELGYRRLEWKCNAENARSMRAATRLGFSYEGLFRQHMLIKGRNRDTAWFALLDHQWPACGEALERWLQADNFDAHGQQRRRLEALRGDPR
ncbi:GNAT family N-acetyltransferase [Stutzerimonas stutzeri]|uniref:GNAT family N-acetyltransferase n=1 Tax=Stutzerimonas stutzeri TaxID=316 RepID=UPI0003195E70|nr:GNAT family protein [Stutzerimonas stutzeri]